MFTRHAPSPLLILSLVAAALSGGCSRSAPTANSTSVTVSSSPSEPNAGIEVEIVQPTAIEGAIQATGKVVVTDDKTASIGPVHEGRIINLYAGQGSYVR